MAVIRLLWFHISYILRLLVSFLDFKILFLCFLNEGIFEEVYKFVFDHSTINAYLLIFKRLLLIAVEQVASEAGIIDYQYCLATLGKKNDALVLMRKMMQEMNSLMMKMRSILEKPILHLTRSNLMVLVYKVEYQYLELVGL